MNNPFYEELEHRFRTSQLTVRKDGTVYRGWMVKWNFNDDQLLLDDAVRIEPDQREIEVGSIYIRKPDTVEREPETRGTVRSIDIGDIEPSPYSQREFDHPDFYDYVREVRRERALTSYPEVSPYEDYYLIVSGHKRIEAARRAGFDSVAVIVRDLTDWEVDRRFLDEHIPATEGELNDGKDQHRGWYNAEAVEAALEMMVNDWGEEQIRKHYAARKWLDGELPPEEDEEGTAAEVEN